jgi:hypothetical protein
MHTKCTHATARGVRPTLPPPCLAERDGAGYLRSGGEEEEEEEDEEEEAEGAGFETWKQR